MLKEDSPKVEALDGYVCPEETICRAARGDYMNGPSTVSFDEVMEGVTESDDAFDKALNYEYAYEYELDTLTRMISLIEQLIDRQHWGPFEHAQLTMSVEGISRVCMAQGTRHRLFTFDVQSQRYVDFSEGTEVVLPATIRGASLNREQGLTELDAEDREKANEIFTKSVKQSVQDYEDLLDLNIPKEDARFVLPEGTTVNMTMSGNIRMYMHILNMRGKADAQWEIRDLMDKMFEECRNYMPITFDYFEEKTPLNLSP